MKLDAERQDEGKFLRGFIIGLPLGLIGLFGLLPLCFIDFQKKTRPGFIAGVMTTVAILTTAGLIYWLVFRDPHENESTLIGLGRLG